MHRNVWLEPKLVCLYYLCYLPLISPGCDPAEEGKPTNITCDLDTTKCRNLFVVKWNLGGRDLSTCTKSTCDSFTGNNKIDATTTINQSSSTLTVKDVSRTSSNYNSQTKWICSPCGGQGITVCNGLEIYGEFVGFLR